MYGLNLYGNYKYAEGIANEEEIKNRSPDLMKYLPYYYYESAATKNLMEVHSLEVGKADLYIEDVEKQLYINTATWGLNLWEDVFGIATNLNSSYEDRREVIKARMRGQGTTTKAMIKNVAESFSGGEVKIIEDNENYKFIVKFIGVKGIPRNMGNFLDMLETIKPAHLGYEIKYTYTVWNNFIDNKLTWNGANEKTWNDIKTYE
ncbi:YmfQ family protein [Clostridium butyricum]|uniref:YmfQ family protein n=1 Tax=Clostridium butyricum TaxID=1492 RepID=UPI002ABD9CE3|nr:YmfQ family protein [Clostridium butyricum]